jgi:hypothetical protein
MKASELMIGNWFNVPRQDQSPFRIDGFEYLSNEYGKVEMQLVPNGHPLTWELKDITAIPLNEEWLINSGCKKHTSTFGEWFTFRNYIIEKHLIGDGYNLRQIIGKKESICINHKMFFVHHWQNLIHALTGEELEIKKEFVK